MTYVSKTIVPGATLVATWGYEQTNATFFRVDAVKGQFATLQPLATVNRWVEDTMRGTAVPGEPEGKPIRRKVQPWQYGDFCKTEHGGGAKRWDGAPVPVTCYG